MKYNLVWLLSMFYACVAAQNVEPQRDALALYDSLYTSMSDTIGDPFLYMDNVDVLDKSEYIIPSAPAFALLGVTPELVNRPGVVRDFKVDWRIKNYEIAPDFALEAQPVWLFHFNKKGLLHYAQSSPLMQTLSTTSISLGTAKLDGVNHFSYALKMTLYREKDPLKDKALMTEIFLEEAESKREIEANLVELRAELARTKDKSERKNIRRQIDFFMLQKRDRQLRIQDRMRTIADRHAADNWNASALDIAYGRVFTFNNNAADATYINQAGSAFWVNGALRLGRRGVLGGIVKLKRVGGLSESMFGANVRYGGGKFSFYTEVVSESAFERNAEMLSPEDPFSDKFSKDLGISWIAPIDQVEKERTITIAYGGDFRLSRGILLNFALRTQFQNDFSFNKLIPVANVTCLMR